MKCKFEFLGFSTFLITTANGKRILIDPYVNDNKACKYDSGDLNDIDLIIVSHGAFDHMKDTPEIAISNNCPVICGGEVKPLLIEQGVLV